MSVPRTDTGRLRQGRFDRIAGAIDDYFLSPELRNAPAAELANVRMGLLLALATSVGALAFMPIQFALWPPTIAWAAAAISLAVLALPFAARQTSGVRHLGQIVCATVAIGSSFSLWMSGGQAVGILPFLPALPILGLLVGGSRGALAWTAGGLVVGGFGLWLIAAGAPPSADYAGSSAFDRYVIALICVLGIGLLSQVFETFWNRTAIEVADRAQAELIAREERNASLLEHASEGVLVVDPFAVVEFASKAAERLLGVSPGESIGRRLRDFTAHDDFVSNFHVFQRAVAVPDSVAELQVRTRPNLGRAPESEGRVLDLVLANQLANPAVRGMVIRMRDVTELVRAEANYQALIDHSIQGIAVECDGRIVYANEALAKLFRSTRETMMGLDSAAGIRRVHADDRERVLDVYAATGPGMAEARFGFAPGDELWVRLRWAPASWRGRPARQIAFADITLEKQEAERREAENERLAAAIEERTLELEASQLRLREQDRMATVGTLAAGIAHQINNPIGSILTSADFAILTEGEPDGDQIRSDALEDIRSQAIRCGKIVRSVLQFSRAEPTEKWPSDLTSVLRTAVDVTAHYAREREATVELHLDAEASDRRTRMNPIELEQVFVNLIRNAVEAQPRGARVSVSSRAADDEQIEVVIADDGPGVEPANASSVFDPFYTTRLREGGTGLGLSVAHGIVVDHGGSMWLDTNPRDPDEPFAGARFHVVLPTEKPGPPARR
ncbi:MAG: ATP-binding protein [bacterium]|nr:ATP-binding protein [bacterium]